MGSHRYRIIVSGTLGELTRQAFDDLCVESNGADTGLTGELDQAGLFGVLNRIMDFGLELMALSRIDNELPDPARLRHAADPMLSSGPARPNSTRSNTLSTSLRPELAKRLRRYVAAPLGWQGRPKLTIGEGDGADR